MTINLPNQEHKWLFSVRLNNKRRTVNLEELLYLKSDSNYTYFHFSNGNRSMSAFTMKQILKRMEEPPIIYRINRSISVNISAIKVIKRYQVTLKNGEVFPVSRSRYEQLIETIEFSKILDQQGIKRFCA